MCGIGKPIPRILVVDDSRAVRVYVRELLEGEYEIREASTPFSALEEIEKSPPDLLLLDIEMPLMSGMELLARLDPDRLFSVILFTTRTSIDSIVHGLESGADDYLIKPFDEREFRARITAGLRSALKRRELDWARRRAEDALERLARAEQECLMRERINAIASLAAGAAHQINNPLGFVLSNVGVLERYGRLLLQAIDELLAISPGKGEEILSRLRIARVRDDIFPLLSEISHGLGRIGMIVKGLSRLQPAMDFHKRERLDLAPLVTAILEIHRDTLPEGRRMTMVRLDDPVMVEVAPSLLQTVLDELLANAIEGVSGEEIQVSVTREGGWGVVTVSNPVDFLDDRDVSRFTEPFFTLKSPDEHAGLGLAVVERFVLSQGGQLDISHGEGRLTVRVRLPLVE